MNLKRLYWWLVLSALMLGGTPFSAFVVYPINEWSFSQFLEHMHKYQDSFLWFSWPARMILAAGLLYFSVEVSRLSNRHK